MTDQEPAHRSRRGAGRDAKRAAPLAHAIEAVPFITRKIPYYEVLGEEVDLPVNKRHFDTVYSHMRYSDKPFMGSVTHPLRAQDSGEMAKVLFGADYLDPLTGRPKTIMTSLINANSPLTWDATMLGA